MKERATAKATAAVRRLAPAALLLRCLLLGSVAALPVAFNAVVDPARLVTSRDAEREIAGALLAGHYVTDITNYDDRTIHRELALMRRTPVDVLALGSSRVQPLGAGAFPGAASFANAGVSGGSLDDVLAMYEPWDDAVRRPRRIVLEVDPWMLGAEDQAAAWGSVAGARARMLARLGLPAPPRWERLVIAVRTLTRLASPEYFRLALFSVRHHGLRGVPFVIADREQHAQKTMHPDGSLTWMPTTSAEAEGFARSYVRATLPGDVRYHGLERTQGARAEQVLARLLRHMLSSGAAVTVLLGPYQPVTWSAFARQPVSPLFVAEQRFRALAAGAGARVTGSYDPARCGMTKEDFFDESHARPAALARVIGGACEPR